MEQSFRVISLLLYIPFMLWGIHTLRLRYQKHVDLAITTEAFTLAGLVVFYAIEMKLVDMGSHGMPTFRMLSVIGLLISGVALYGPMVISLLSHTLVEQIMPGRGSGASSEPRYAEAESLERRGDYEAALREYLAISACFPHAPIPMLRIADNLMKQDKPDQAVQWFERAIERMETPERALSATNRVAEIYQRRLERPRDAARVLERYLERFPATAHSDSVRRRLRLLEEA